MPPVSDATVSSSNDACPWRAVCAVKEVPIGEIRSFAFEGAGAIAVYNVGGVFYATDDGCTHQEISLSEGELVDDIVECPLHGGSFNVITGEVITRPPRQPLRTHRTHMDGETVYIEVSGGSA
jgi:nitrite reductase/ring-hydroxylating ferredoxin subunit